MVGLLWALGLHAEPSLIRTLLGACGLSSLRDEVQTLPSVWAHSLVARHSPGHWVPSPGWCLYSQLPPRWGAGTPRWMGTLPSCLFILFLNEREGKEKERERNINVWLPHVYSILGTLLTTQARALTGNQSSYPLFCSPVLNPLRHTSQGWVVYWLRKLNIWIHVDELIKSISNIFIN